MPAFRVVTDIAAPPAACFDLSRSIDLHLESMIASGEKAVAGVTSGLIAAGEEVSWEARHFGILWRMTSRIVEFDPPHRFVDEMVRGPFAAFRHEHQFDPAGAGCRMTGPGGRSSEHSSGAIEDGTRMTDVITFRMALAPVNLPAGLYLKRLMRIRNAAIRQAAER